MFDCRKIAFEQELASYRPKSAKNLCFEQCLDLDFIGKVAVICFISILVYIL